MVRAAVVLAVALLAGCLAPAAELEPLPPAGAAPLPFENVMGQDHDHTDISLHAHAYRFEETAHHPLDGDALHSAGAHAIDLKAGHLFVATYGEYVDARGGVFIFDAADPFAPELVGRYRFAGNLGGDRSMEATPDGSFVVLGTELATCGGHVNPFGPGLYLVDARDKGRPVLADYEANLGVHSVVVHRIGGADYVFAGASGGQNVYRIETGTPAKLTPVASLPIGHDASVQDDPLSGRTLLYGATGGVEIWDVTDPTAPQELALIQLDSEEWDARWIHSVEAQIIDGRRILFASSEDSDDISSLAWVFDATDLEDVRLLSTWSAGDVPAGPALRWSMHNPRFLGDVVVLAHYHGGVWGIDLADPARPAVVGQYMPARDTGFIPTPRPNPLCGDAQFHDLPYVFDVEVGEGVVYAADLHTGLYALKPTW